MRGGLRNSMTSGHCEMQLADPDEYFTSTVTKYRILTLWASKPAAMQGTQGRRRAALQSID